MAVYLSRANLSPVLNWPLIFMVIRAVFTIEVSPMLAPITKVEVSFG